MNYVYMANNLTQAYLYPFPATTLSNTEVVIKLTHPIGSIDTISILSSRSPLPLPLFRFTQTLSRIVWLLIFISVIVFSLIHLTVTSKQIDAYFKFLFAQQLTAGLIARLPQNKTIKYLLLHWMIVATILQFCFKAVMLTNLLSSIPYSQIDSLSDLADKNLPFCVFTGEPAQGYIESLENEITRKLHRKYVIEDPPTEEKEMWEAKTFSMISAGKYAIVSDGSFLDYYHSRFINKYPNLYRSQVNFLPLPYYIPLSKYSSLKLIERFTKL